MKANSSVKASRVSLRIAPQQKLLITRAAKLKQTTVSTFMLERACEAARQVLADQVHFSLSESRWRAFCAALDAPPKEIPALRRLLTEPGVFDVR